MRKFILMSTALLCLASPSLALSDKPYITAADIDIASLLPSPPVETSPAGKLDLETIINLQKGMPPERDRQIHADVDQTVYQIAGPVLGANFTKANFPLTGAFIDKVVKDAGFGVGPIKQKYNRITSGAAYPSDAEGGHMAATLAVNQMMKNPAFRADFDAVKTELRKGLGLN